MTQQLVAQKEAAFKRARSDPGLRVEWASAKRLLEEAIAGGMDRQLLLNFYARVRQLAADIRASEPLLVLSVVPALELAVARRCAKEVNAPRIYIRLSDLFPGWAGPEEPDSNPSQEPFIIDLEAPIK